MSVKTVLYCAISCFHTMVRFVFSRSISTYFSKILCFFNICRIRMYVTEGARLPWLLTHKGTLFNLKQKHNIDLFFVHRIIDERKTL